MLGIFIPNIIVVSSVVVSSDYYTLLTVVITKVRAILSSGLFSASKLALVLSLDVKTVGRNITKYNFNKMCQWRLCIFQLQILQVVTW